MNFINCSNGKRVFNLKPFVTLLLLMLLLSPFLKVKAQTTLSAGDVAFTAFNAESTASDTFAIMLLTNISSGTKIVFTDGCWTDAGGYFQLNSARTEFLFEWEATSAMNAYTQIKFWGSATTVTKTTVGTSAGQVNYGTALSLPPSGDQLFAFQGVSSIDTSTNHRVTPTTMLAAIHMNVSSAVTTGTSNWDNGCSSTSATDSELPNALTNGTNAVWVYATGPTEHDNARYDCSVASGTAATVRAAINDVANWDTDDGTPYSPATCTAVTSTTWNGTTWSTTPSSSLDAIIASSTTPGAFSCEDLTINSSIALTLNSGVTATIYGDVTNSGNGTSGTGTLQFAKTGTQSLNGTAFTHSGVIEVVTGATLTTNSKLTIANGGSLMHGTSTPNGGGSVSGSVTFEKTIGSTNKGWRMFALPVDALIDNFETGLNTLCSDHTPSGERNVYYYDGAAGAAAPISGNYAVGWTQANNSSDDENKAYSIYLDNTSHGAWDFSSTVSITGTPNDGTKTFSLGYNYDPASTGTSSIQRGWNQIPNYFPSNLGVYNLINDANFGSTYKAIHVWNQGLGQMVGINQSTMNSYNNSSTSVFSTTRQIPPFMAFWVKATSTSQSIQLKNAMRTSRTDSLPANTYFKKEYDIFRVMVKDADGKNDQFSVCFDEAATDAMDYTMDIYKFRSFSDEVPTLYTMVDGDMMSLNAVPIKESYTMPLYMESFTNGKEYTFSPIVEEYNDFFDVELVDNKTGAKTLLLGKNYSFKHDADYKGARFTLNFTKKATTSVDELFSREKMWAFTNENGIGVTYTNNNEAAKAKVEIYNIMGQKLFTSSTISPDETVTFKPSGSGKNNVYIAHVISNGKTKTIKVIY